MTISNLALPAWILINCSEPVLANIVCELKPKMDTNHSTSRDQRDVCDEAQIIHRGLCFQFLEAVKNNEVLQNNMTGQFEEKLCFQSGLKGRMTISGNSSRDLLETIFLATNIQTMAFVYFAKLARPERVQFFSAGLAKTVLRRKGESNEKHILSCTLTTRNIDGDDSGSLFPCQNLQYISTVFVFDGVDDCQDHNITGRSRDEFHIIYKGQNLEKCQSSALFYITQKMKCKSFVFPLEPHVLKVQLALNRVMTKQSPRFLCGEKSTQHFSILDICIYEVNSQHEIVPCAGGSHLQECSKFECNAKFKCFGFYCIPWKYVCNNLWDCPNGYDEASVQCPDNRACQHMFKCRQSYICISLLDICNHITDCPLHDDELLCQLHTRKCLRGCECFNLAIKCHNITYLDRKLSSLPFVSFHIVFCELHQIVPQKHVLQMNLTHNAITEVCDTKAKNLVKMDISNNYVVSLSKNCFSSFSKLTLLSFRNNKISLIEAHAFANISSPFSLNLENNLICTFSENIFGEEVNILVLNMKDNPISCVQLSSYSVALLITDLEEMCLAAPVEAACNKQPQWYKLNTKIIENSALYFIIIVMSVLIFMVNVFTMVFPSNNAKSFQVILGSLKVSNILCSVYLVTLWGVNQHYKELFMFSSQAWQGSFPCSLAYFALLTHTISTPQLYTLTAFARNSVTKYPLLSKFKSHTFVIKWVLLLGLMSVVIALGLTCSATFTTIIPNPMCLPFVDPTKHLLQTYIICFCIFLIQICACVSIVALYVKMASHIKLSGIEAGTPRH